MKNKEMLEEGNTTPNVDGNNNQNITPETGENNSSNNNKSNDDFIATIVILSILLVIAIIVAIYFGLRNKDDDTPEEVNPDPDIVEPGPVEDPDGDDDEPDEGEPTHIHSSASYGYLIDEYTEDDVHTGLIEFTCDECGLPYIETRELYFASDTWDTISEYASSGEASSRYYIGETRDISIQETYSSTTYTEDITLRIVDFDHDDLSEEDDHYNDTEYNHGSNKAAITLETVTLLRNTYSFSNSSDNTGGWSGSSIRDNLNDKSNTSSLYNTLIPSELSPLLRTVDKSSNTGESTKEITTSSDTLFLFSLAELYSKETILNTTSYEQVSDYGEIYSKEGSQYRYYSHFLGDSDPSTKNNELAKVAVTGSWDTTRNKWLTRTATLDNSMHVFYIESTGDLYYTITNIARNVSVGFCL